jgi:hypothetical protein
VFNARAIPRGAPDPVSRIDCRAVFVIPRPARFAEPTLRGLPSRRHSVVIVTNVAAYKCGQCSSDPSAAQKSAEFPGTDGPRQHDGVLHQQVTGSVATVTAPTGAAFDIVLLLHVVCVLVGFASLVVTGTQAWRARVGPEAPGSESVARYFRPGVNWPGRALYGVIVLGFVLVAMSQGAYGLDDRFVQLGLVLWIVCVAVAELVVWPGERRVQRVVADGWQGGDLRRIGGRVAASAWAICVVIVVASVIMVQKP